MKVIIMSVVLTVSILTGFPALADNEGCYYNPALINREYVLKHTQFRNIIWDDSKKEAQIPLENKDKVFLAYAACEQFGLAAKYMMKPSREKISASVFINKIKWLGERILDGSDFNLLVRSLNDKQFYRDLEQIKTEGRVFLGIDGSVHQSFLISAVDEKDELFIEISWQD